MENHLNINKNKVYIFYQKKTFKFGDSEKLQNY